MIGDGFFTSISNRKGELIADFTFEFITEIEGKKRSSYGFKGYVIVYTNYIVVVVNKYCLNLK